MIRDEEGHVITYLLQVRIKGINKPDGGHTSYVEATREAASIIDSLEDRDKWGWDIIQPPAKWKKKNDKGDYITITERKPTEEGEAPKD